MVVTALHLLQVLVWGAYRAPRELNWIVGLLLMLVVVAFAMTGFGLPWDQKGYWAKLVETSIAGTVPLVGRLIERVVQGGGAYGNYTVTHLYTVHVFVLPAAAGVAAAAAPVPGAAPPADAALVADARRMPPAAPAGTGRARRSGTRWDRPSPS